MTAPKVRTSRSITLAGVLSFLAAMPGLTALASSSPLVARIQAKAASIAPDLIDIRRHIHMHPELSGDEAQTAALVAARLEKLGLEVKTGVGGHGVVAVLRGAKPGPVVAYRADMDAVPSPVVGDVTYRSRVEGVKHVCGHDAHVAIALGVAEVLASVRDQLPGMVKFIFQPAEENAQGAAAMIRDGVLEKPRPHAIFALHTFPTPVGSVGCPAGVGLSGLEPFQVSLSGDGDVASAEGDILKAIQAMNSVPPITGPETYVHIMEEIVQQDGAFEDYIFVQALNAAAGDDGARVISGGVRAPNDDSYERARGMIQDAVSRVGGEGVDASVEFGGEGMLRLPNMDSDADLIEWAIPHIQAVLGAESTYMIHASIPYFGEDFAFFQEHIPGAMFFLGVANPDKGVRAYNHFPDYDIDESALELGAAAMANVLLQHLMSR